MNLTLEEINNLVNGTILNKPDKKLNIKGVASLEDAREDELSIFSDRRFFKQFLKTKASAVIIAENLIDNDLIGKTKIPIIKVKNPQLAFIEILKIIEKEKRHIEKGIHKTAIISEKAQIDSNVNIGAYVVIEENVKIGRNTTILSQCFIGENTKIGNSCLIYPQVVIREDTEIADNVIIHSGTIIGSDGFGYVKISETGEHKKIPQIGKVIIEDNVEIGANVTIDRATTGKTIIGSGTKIDNLVHIAHNVKIGKNCIIIAQVGIAGSCKIGNSVTLAGQAGIADHIEIGDNAIIAAQSGVIGNIKPYEIVSGYPARPHKKQLKIQAILNNLPEILKKKMDK